MVYCSPKCQQRTTFTVGGVFLLLGIFFAFIFDIIFQKILDHQLSVSNENTKGFNMWKETPIPMYLEFHLFNWTNAVEYSLNKSIKPEFKECGPYTFYEHHIRENITFNSNNTVTFYNKRSWKFEPDKTNGSLDDQITTLNPIVVTVGSIIKFKHIIVKMGVNFFLEEKHEKLYITKSARELLFEGYQDPLVDLVHKLNMSINLPFTKFGWFVERNNSVQYDGLYNMYDGGDNIDNLGVIHSWNYQEKIPWYHNDCAIVRGTTGELWYPPKDKKTVSIFASDLCSVIDMDWTDSYELHGISGHKYLATIDNFDNGTIHPKRKCYVPDGIVDQPNGVRNVSTCKFGAPAFVSLPHFYLADPMYREAVIGMNPDKSKHEMWLALEPTTGLPLKIEAKLQLNLVMEPIEGLNILAGVSKTTMPAFWFRQYAELSEDLSNVGKLIIIAPSIGQYTGYGLIGLAVLILGIGTFLTIRKAWTPENYKV